MSPVIPVRKTARLGAGVRQMMVACAVAGLVLLVTKFVFIDNRPIDILGDAISALDGHFTVFADGYDETKFRSIRAGMTARQVEDLMGPPLSRGQWQAPTPGQPITPGEGHLDECWSYTRPGKANGNYWWRVVWFQNGVVYGTDRHFWVD